MNKIKLVIEIEDELYNHVKNSYRTGIGTKSGVDLGYAVAQGIPLEKYLADQELKNFIDGCKQAQILHDND